jgi:HPt (histidine-containing phosphotransfer) domain-containing protein
MRRMVLAAVLIGTGVAACGGGDSGDARGRVSSYVHRANAIERQYGSQFKAANAAYVAFAKGKLGSRAAVVRLGAAQRAIVEARRRLAGIRPPAEAATLRTRLLRYLDMNAAFARQTTWLARYQRRSPAVLAPLTAANARLRRELQSATTSGQAAAMGGFAGALGRALHGMDALTVPGILRPAHDAQVRRLRRTRSLALQLRSALLAQDAQDVARLLLRFRRNAASTGASRGQSARAIDAYDRRFHRLTRAYADVRREQVRLDRSLG